MNYDRVVQILTELGETPEAYALIAREAQTAGMSAADLAAAISTPELPISEADVLRFAEESGQPFLSSDDNINIDDTGSSVTIGDSSGVTVDTSGGSTPVVNDGPTLGGSTPETVPGLSNLTPDQLAFAQTLPVDLQDDYIAAVGAGFGDETSGLTVPSLAELLRDRGLTFEEAAQAVGLTPDDENYSDAVRSFYNVQPLAPPPLDVSTLTPEQIALIRSEYSLQPIPVQPTVDLSSLNPDQLAFAQTLPVNLQDDYVAAVGAGLGVEGTTVQDIADLLRDRGLTFSETATATGLTPDMSNYDEAVRSFYNLQPPTDLGALTPDQLSTISSTYNLQPPTDLSALTPDQLSTISSTYNLQPAPVAPVVDLSSLTPDQLAFAQNLPANLQDDYVAAVAAGFGDETSGLTTTDIAGLLRDRGLNFEDAATTVGLLPDMENYNEAVRAFYQLNPQLTSGGLEFIDYTSFPGGNFGPGEALPNTPDPITGIMGPRPYTPFVQPTTTDQTQSTTLFSPSISTFSQPPASGAAGAAGVGYSYPQPFGEIDIFGRPAATTPTAYTPPTTTTT